LVVVELLSSWRDFLQEMFLVADGEMLIVTCCFIVEFGRLPAAEHFHKCINFVIQQYDAYNYVNNDFLHKSDVIASGMSLPRQK